MILMGNLLDYAWILPSILLALLLIDALFRQRSKNDLNPNDSKNSSYLSEAEPSRTIGSSPPGFRKVYEVPSGIEAELMKFFLEEQGIEVQIRGSSYRGFWGYRPPTKATGSEMDIWVPKDLASQASRIIQDQWQEFLIQDKSSSSQSPRTP